MFHDIAEPTVRVGSRKACVVPVSIAAHVSIVVLAFLAQLVFPGALPSPAATLRAVWLPQDIVLPPDPAPAPLPVGAKPLASPPAGQASRDAAPVQAPDAIRPEAPIERVTSRPVGTIDGLGDARSAIAEPPVPAASAPPPVPEAPRRIGGDIRPPAKLAHVAPEYPAIARAARTEGVVIIETTIGVDGRVTEARVLRSVPLLDDAALAAVQQWVFTPTLLNGTPVAVVMTVTVTFSLN